MIGVIAFVLVSGQVPDARDAYAAAGKLLSEPGFAIATQIRYHQVEDPPATLPKGLSLTMTPLEAVRWQSKTLEEILRLIQKGNDLPYSPAVQAREDTSAADFPELALQKGIAKAMADYAWLKLSEGKSSDAAKIVQATEGMSDRGAGESLIHYLVAVAIDAILLAVVNEFLPVFTPTDWDRLEAIASRKIADVDLLGRVFEGDFNSSLKYYDLMRTDIPTPDFLSSDEESKPKEFTDATTKAYFKGLTKERWNAIIDNYIEQKRNTVAALKQGLRRPESEWKTHLYDENLKSPKVIRNDSDMGIALKILLSDTNFDQAVFKNRAQSRLLLLHARVRKYFWNYRKFPASLKDVATAAEMYDPLSRKPFVYEKLDGGYKLVSSGRPGMIGEVALKYRRPPNSQSDRADGPP